VGAYLGGLGKRCSGLDEGPVDPTVGAPQRPGGQPGVNHRQVREEAGEGAAGIETRRDRHEQINWVVYILSALSGPQ